MLIRLTDAGRDGYPSAIHKTASKTFKLVAASSFLDNHFAATSASSIAAKIHSYSLIISLEDGLGKNITLPNDGLPSKILMKEDGRQEVIN